MSFVGAAANSGAIVNKTLDGKSCQHFSMIREFVDMQRNRVHSRKCCNGVSSVKITGAQIRAARAFLKWNIADLAKAADVGDSTVRSIEKVASIKGGGMENTLDYRIAVRAEALAKIVRALEKAGITFLPANAQGVGIRGKVG
jgi:hypothetical protein